jgi:carbon monoxide dehydrogenase subunit G
LIECSGGKEFHLAEVRHSTTARLPVEAIWKFVEDMDNWARYVVGYQSHEKLSTDRSVWVLKGDVGVLQRVVKFNVNVTEWAGPKQVHFELEGVNEPMKGSGTFSMDRYEDGDVGEDPANEDAGPGFVGRIIEGLLRFFQRLLRGRVERGAGADEGPGAGMAQLTFELRIEPGGPMAPMIDALIRPAMRVAAEDLATRIVARCEADRDRNPSAPLQPELQGQSQQK